MQVSLVDRDQTKLVVSLNESFGISLKLLCQNSFVIFHSYGGIVISL